MSRDICPPAGSPDCAGDCDRCPRDPDARRDREQARADAAMDQWEEELYD